MAKPTGIAHGPRTLAYIWKAFGQLNPANVRKESERVIRVGVVGREELLREAAAFLLGPDPTAYDRAGDVLVLLPTPLDAAAYGILPRCDIVLYQAGSVDTLPGLANGRGFRFRSVDDLPALINRILNEPSLSYAHLPLARAIPAFRPEVTKRIIQSVSIENAIFVASTSLGNVVPNPLQPLTSVAEALGDLVVLTANQYRMLFMLAAAHNQQLGLAQQAPEAASILGAAFGWRSVARELVGKIPLGGGVLPKAAIAFAGTWAVGDGLVYYYTTGKRLTREDVKKRFEEAYEKGRVAVESAVERVRETYSRRL